MAKEKKHKSHKTMEDSNTHKISKVSNAMFHTVFIIAALTCILPLMLVVMASFTDDMSLRLNGYTLFPKEFSLAAYQLVFARGEAVLSAFKNSLVISLVGTVCSTLVIAMYAYPLSRPNFRYRKIFTWLVLFTMLFSGGLVPWYIMYSQVLGLIDTLPVLIIPYLMNAWYVIIMRTFYRTTIPEEVLESAKVDGAGEFRTFFTIALPLSTAGLATVALFSMLIYWNDWYLPLIYSRSDSLDTIQNYLRRILERVEFLARMAGQLGSVTVNVRDLPSETIRMAIAVVAIGPLIFAYPFFQRYFVKGLTLGSVKG